MSRTARHGNCRRSLLVLMAGLGLSVAAVPDLATAGPLFSAGVDASTSFPESDQIRHFVPFGEDPVSLSADLTTAGEPTGARASAAAGIGGSLVPRIREESARLGLSPGVLLRGASFTNQLGLGDDTTHASNADSLSRVTIDDLVVSGPASFDGTVGITPLFQVNGRLRAPGSADNVTNSAAVRIDLNLSGPGFDHSLSNKGLVSTLDIPNTSENLRRSGFLSFADISLTGRGAFEVEGIVPAYFQDGSPFTEAGVIAEHPFFVRPGEPFSMEVQLTTFASIAHLHSIAESVWDNSLGFPTSGPVFDLPDGFTINSAQAGIVNNRFLGAQQVIPEPSSLALLGMGAIGLAGVGWRRKRIGQAPQERSA